MARKRSSRLWFYLVYLIIVTGIIVSVTLSKYVATVSGTGTTTIATTVAAVSELSLNTANARMVPGASRMYSFRVTNETSGRTSDVAQDYSIEVLTTGNLPLQFALDAKGGGTADHMALKRNGEENVWTGGFLPFGSAETHSYVLTVTWPSAAAAAQYQNEIDLITVRVEAKQAMPVAP